MQMIELKKSEYPAALALFRNSGHHMKLAALREGRIEARVFADAPEPSLACVLYKNKLLIASALPAGSLAPLLKPFLLEQVYEKRMGCGAGEAQIFWDGAHVCEAALSALEDKCPARTMHEYYELSDAARCKDAPVPEGYALRSVDEALLREGLLRTDELRAEMCSERVSEEAFLREGFGVCAVAENELAGWCLSEYNCSQGCEAGIWVGEGHRRRGLAPAMVAALARELARRGGGRIGWHCYRSNTASSATALAAGFEKKLEYGELLCFFDEALQYAVNGNLLDGAGDYAGAVEWYTRAVRLPSAPLWAWVRMAMALVSLGRFGEAFAALRAAVQKGFNNWNWLRWEPRLEPLRGEEDWRQLF
jgi:RimJ/RimL family protein N-acetyltransferase